MKVQSTLIRGSVLSLHSSQHGAIREHGQRLRPAGLSIPGPGALLLHQHVLVGASTDTVTVEHLPDPFRHRRQPESSVVQFVKVKWGEVISGV